MDVATDFVESALIEFAFSLVLGCLRVGSKRFLVQTHATTGEIKHKSMHERI
jgi:hypothetical protein